MKYKTPYTKRCRSKESGGVVTSVGWNLTNGVGPAGGADQALLNYIHVDLVAHRVWDICIQGE